MGSSRSISFTNRQNRIYPNVCLTVRSFALGFELGCDLEHLFLEMEECFGEMLAQEEGAAPVEINPELIPEIHLDEEALTKAIAEHSSEVVE